MPTIWRSIIFRMKGHHSTLKLLFKNPPPPIPWQKVKQLLSDCGVAVIPAHGDGTYLELNGVRMEIYTPSDKTPSPTISKIKIFLSKTGITPAEIGLFLTKVGTP